jgi:hypothetical protein
MTEGDLSNVSSIESTKIIEKSYPTPLKIGYEDIFITEENTFDVVVKYHKDGNKLLVEKIDDNYNEENSSSITVTFKYPSQGDVTAIASHPLRDSVKGLDNTLDITGFYLLESARMLCLIRKWSIDKPIDHKSIMELNPKIVKAIISGIREAI